MGQNMKQSNESYYCPSDMPLKLHSISKIPSAYHNVHPRTAHSHSDEIELYYAMNGSSELLLDCAPYYISDGDLVIIDSGVIHDEIRNRNHNMDSFVLSVGGIKLPQIPENRLIHDGQSPLIPSGPHSKFIFKLMECINDSIEEDYKDSVNICNELLHPLINRILLLLQDASIHTSSLTADKKSARKEIQTIKNYIDSNYMNDISLNDLSDNMHLTTYHISHIFKNATNFSPMQYLTRRRLGEAETLLIKTDDQITKIAIQVGYGTVSNFNNSFLKYIGISPMQYRINHRKIQDTIMS